VLLHFGDLERKRPDVLNRLQKAGIDTAQKVSEYEMVTTMAKEYAKLTGVTCLAVACSLYGIIGGRRLNAAIGDTEGSNRQGQASKNLATAAACCRTTWASLGQSTWVWSAYVVAEQATMPGLALRQRGRLWASLLLVRGGIAGCGQPRQASGGHVGGHARGPTTTTCCLHLHPLQAQVKMRN
jgi:hypothetical protein